MYGTSQVNHDRIDWETPKIGRLSKKDIWTLAMLKEKFKLKLDVCAKDEGCACCDDYYTPAEDGLKQPWEMNFYMNPPFKTIDEWCLKAVNESLKHKVTGVGLLPAFMGSAWFHDLILPHARIIPIRGRIHYWENGEPSNSSPNFDSMIVVWNYG